MVNEISVFGNSLPVAVIVKKATLVFVSRFQNTRVVAGLSYVPGYAGFNDGYPVWIESLSDTYCTIFTISL
tara:strand:+ start:794 stop:1006 length:213 start_codon:yes stop_codon:yes gene_type:complete